MILASTRSGTERAISEVQSVSKEFGLDSILKTKHMVAGSEVADSDKTPIPVTDSKIAGVEELGSTMATSNGIDADVQRLL